MALDILQLILAERPSGKFKLYIQTESQNRSNIRWHAIPEQPRMGFKERDEAVWFAKSHKAMIKLWTPNNEGVHFTQVESFCRSWEWIGV